MRSLRTQSNYPASTAALDSELQPHLELIRDGRRKEDGIGLGETVAEEFLALRGRRRFECHSSCLRTYLAAGKLSAEPPKQGRQIFSSGTLNLVDCRAMYGFSNLKNVL
jgi:hypothetical protein